jgi:hypothetical protein
MSDAPWGLLLVVPTLVCLSVGVSIGLLIGWVIWA